MKKTVVMALCALMLFTGCASYAGQGAVTGGSFGAILGSAIGGISGGRRGSDVGTLIGVASGAAIGAAIGSAADQQVANRREEYRRQQAEHDYYSGRVSSSDNSYDNSGFDASNSGDDRIDFDGAGPRNGNGSYSAARPRSYTPSEASDPGYRVKYNSLIEIRNARIIDADHNGVLCAGEECRVTFEVMNNSSKTLYDVQPTVFDVTGNKHIHVSPNLHVESIAPNSGIRYTASILADSKLKDGTIIIRVAVAQGNREITSQVQEFTVRTQRKR